MGNTDSTQTLGERVNAARSKLKEDMKIQTERAQYLETNSPETMEVMMESISTSFASCSPFLEPVLLIAFQSNPDKCRTIVLDCCSKVLSAPIIKEEYQWFKQYVFGSSIWMMQIKDKYMFEELLDIAKEMGQDIINSMDSIYHHLKSHPKWKDLMDIKNESTVSRQDHERVALLKEKGIRQIVEIKEDENKSHEMQTFIDSNLAVNLLTSTAKSINGEFQRHIETVMNHYGIFGDGPIKKVERCQSKLENDYKDAKYPKAAKLLDLVRCSVTFNTLNQLIVGYTALITHIQQNPSMIELARVKNGFLDPHFTGGYRDIKLNVIYHSSINIGVSMVCEIQLLFGQYLYEKKRIHKLYNILRQELYFQTVVKEVDSNSAVPKDIKDLEFVSTLNVQKEIETDSLRNMYKCSVEPDLALLGFETRNAFGVIDIDKKKVTFQETRTVHSSDSYGSYSHNWIVLNEKKYLSVQTKSNQIKFFKINADNSFEEENEFMISVDKKDTIRYSEFDRNYCNIILIVNASVLQKRSVRNVNEATLSITLEQDISSSGLKQLSLSNDGNLCVVAGGDFTNYFYLIDIEKKQQSKLTSSVLTSTLAPCFINGNNKYLSLGDLEGRVEIWNIVKQEAIKTIFIGTKSIISCMTSTNNILAVGSWDKMLRLFKVSDWSLFYSKEYQMSPYSLHLTTDLKYLTIGGSGGEKCVVLKIK